MKQRTRRNRFATARTDLGSRAGLARARALKQAVRRCLLACAVTATLALTVSVPSHASLTAEGEATTTFYAHGTGGMTVRGSTNELQTVEQNATIVVTVPLAGLRTGVSLRDRHLREKYLEVERYPNAELSVQRSALSFPSDGATIEASARGSLALHGHTQETPFRYAAVRQGNRYAVTAVMPVDIRDFGIKQPSFMGVSIAPDVTVRVRFQVVDSP